MINKEEEQLLKEQGADTEECEEEQQQSEEEGLGEESTRLDPSRLQEQLEKLAAEKEDYYQRYIRLQADFDNFRKRVRKEQQETARYAAQGLVEQLLPILDNFQRALEADTQSEAFKEGVEMIKNQLFSALEQEGLAVIEAEQQPFDPQYHEAVMQVESDRYPDNTVIEVLQTGYILKDRVIRPAMVTVAKQ